MSKAKVRLDSSQRAERHDQILNLGKYRKTLMQAKVLRWEMESLAGYAVPSTAATRNGANGSEVRA
ncbi:MAG: hypothetical protein KGL39_19280 [Patescibacteria group bacterium]|nr:hypothetical protein [Patescibacteria group bacterium]